MNKGFVLCMLMMYLAISTVLCGVLLQSVHYFLISYQQLNNQALLIRSVIVGSALLHRVSPSEDYFFDNNTLYWRYPWHKDTHALVLKKNMLWYMQGTYNNRVLSAIKRKVVLMHYVKEAVFKTTAQGLEYSIRLACRDQTLDLQGVL